MIAGKTTLSDTGYNVPDWDSYFMAMVLIVATKSKDQSTRCGSILVDKDNRVLSIGYNGPFRGFPDEKTIVDRPDKYHVMLHGEENALYNYSGARSDLENTTMYITGRPCTRCLRGMIQCGIRRLVYNKGRRLAIFDTEDGTDLAWQLMVDESGIEICEMDFDERTDLVFKLANEVKENRKIK